MLLTLLLTGAWIAALQAVSGESEVLFSLNWLLGTSLALFGLLPMMLLFCWVGSKMFKREAFSNLKKMPRYSKHPRLWWVFSTLSIMGITVWTGYYMVPLAKDVALGPRTVQGECSLSRQRASRLGKGYHIAERAVITTNGQTQELKISGQEFRQLVGTGEFVPQLSGSSPSSNHACRTSAVKATYLPGTRRVIRVESTGVSAPKPQPETHDGAYPFTCNGDCGPFELQAPNNLSQ